ERRADAEPPAPGPPGAPGEPPAEAGGELAHELPGLGDVTRGELDEGARHELPAPRGATARRGLAGAALVLRDAGVGVRPRFLRRGARACGGRHARHRRLLARAGRPRPPAFPLPARACD